MINVGSTDGDQRNFRSEMRKRLNRDDEINANEAFNQWEKDFGKSFNRMSRVAIFGAFFSFLLGGSFFAFLCWILFKILVHYGIIV